MKIKVFNFESSRMRPWAQNAVAKTAVFLLFGTLAATLPTMLLADSYKVRFVSREDNFKNRVSFEDVDLTPLEGYLKEVHSGVPEEELTLKAQQDLYFIFFNALDRENFLSSPSPRAVVEKIQKLMGLRDNLAKLVTEGKRKARYGNQEDFKAVVEKIKKCAEDTKNTFSSYFLEMNANSYSFRVPRENLESKAAFVLFLLEAERIQERLSVEIDHYFFPSEQEVVDIEDYEMRISVTVLSKSLEKLSRMMQKRLLGR